MIDERFHRSFTKSSMIWLAMSWRWIPLEGFLQEADSFVCSGRWPGNARQRSRRRQRNETVTKKPRHTRRSAADVPVSVPSSLSRRLARPIRTCKGRHLKINQRKPAHKLSLACAAAVLGASKGGPRRRRRSAGSTASDGFGSCRLLRRDRRRAARRTKNLPRPLM